MALWEMGGRKLRVPMRDLLVPDARERMRILCAHGQEFTLFSFGAPTEMERALIRSHEDIIKAWEIGVNWSVFEQEIQAIGDFARQIGIPVYLSRLRSSDEMWAEASGRYYHVINQGFLADDKEQMAGILERPELKEAIKGFVFRLTSDRYPLDGIREASEIASSLGSLASVHLRMCGSNPAEAQEDDAWVARADLQKPSSQRQRTTMSASMPIPSSIMIAAILSGTVCLTGYAIRDRDFMLSDI